MLTVTRVVHASVLLDFGGARILTDPWFSERRFYRPGEPRGIATAAELPALAGIVISHEHYDHCDLDALAAYPDKSVPFAVAKGIARRVRATGFTDVVELDPWESTHLGPVEVIATPASHGVPEVTFILRADGHTAYFGADTRRIADLDEIPARFPEIDLALLPINGLRIRPLGNRQAVMDATEAAGFTRVLRPRLAVPIHYAFTSGPIGDRIMTKSTRNRPDLYRDATTDLAPDTAVHILDPGMPLPVAN
ncbi:MBL fold metallo-hydrolase [Nocardia inohanensis]|uniref:MBL fold metallo-hydrolase n=1 Tax=Nocardia inohanensis TaxID=209246 RepID=UPI000AAEEE26|nr:MBL fold metallo-hydrolase [Nocardia inohanensis]